MKTRAITAFIVFQALACFLSTYAQFTDNFSDGNFSANPAWTGNSADWIVNADGQLQSNNTVANGNFYLSTAHAITGATQWDFWVRLNFNTSSANFVDVYLTASNANISLTTNTGYFVRLGDTPDEISLYRKDANGGIVKLIDGADGILNNSSSTVRIRVIRDAANTWTLSRDVGTIATGVYIPEGTATDATHSGSAAFGIWVRQSTSSFFQRHFFDDFDVKPFAPDVTPPSIVSVNATGANVLEVLFNEALNSASATTLSHYTVNNGVGNPVSATPDAGNPLLIRLVFAAPFPNGATCQLTVNGVRDLAGNMLTNGQASFSFYVPQRYDVVIHEIMVDPSPQIGLPNANWIELRNTSNFTINLQGYRLGRTTGLSGPLPSFLLRPDSMVLICTGSAVPLLSSFGQVLSVTGFPTLPNAGDFIWLTDAAGRIMHGVAYDLSWYQNPVKAEGGWTLEMIDARNPCQGASNWRASNHPSGGTPGRANSIAGSNRDQSGPGLVAAFAPAPNQVRLTFSEPLDSARAASATYSLSNGIGTAVQASVLSPAFTQVLLSLPAPLQPGVIYTVTASGLTDCAGNNIVPNQQTARVGLATTADSLDLVVNELLFNPVPQGVDYVEFFNRSAKILDAANLYFTNRSSTTGNPGTLYALSPVNRLIFPGDYYVLAENPQVIAQQFRVQQPAFLFTAATMPSYPDDKGNVVILNQNGLIIDELPYDQKWHFALVNNREGIALERIDPERPTPLADNWTSAANSAGNGTPTYQNSQYRKEVGNLQGTVRLNPAMFSPDNDGFEDFTLIEFEFPQPGNVATITIFDGLGRPVRVLQRNITLGARGSYRWDGLDDKQQRVPAGNYVVFFEVFDLNGRKQQIKKGVTVARKF